MLAQSIKSSYLKFTASAKHLLHIEDEEHYQQALDIIEELMTDDSSNDAVDGLITLIAHAIEEFESHDEQIVNFHRNSHSGPQDIAVLRFLMSQNNLTGSDLPEIGTKSLVSKILAGERSLTRQHIEKLSSRFHISPEVFF